MAAGIQMEVIKRTQETLGTVIKRPPLNEKLLTKPPFRFLHDIITNVINQTGFMKGLYTQDEMTSDNVKDKEAKIAFLQKAISVVAIVANETLTVKPAKIVAGHEAEKTNEFLQALAKCVLSKKDSGDAVKQVKGGGVATSKAAVKKEAKTKAKPTTKAIPSNKAVSKTQKSIKKTTEAKDSPIKEPVQAIIKIEDPKPVVKASPEKINPESDILSVPNPIAAIASLVSNGNITPEQSPVKVQADAVVEPEPAHVEKPSSAAITKPSSAVKKSRSSSSRPSKVEAKPKNSPEKSFDNRPQSAASMRSARTARTARPTTARPAAPRILNKNIVNVDEGQRAPSAKQVTNLILDDDREDEDEGFVVEDKVEVEDPMAMISTEKFMTEAGEVEDMKQGSLVKQMLETKKDLEGGSQQDGAGAMASVTKSEKTHHKKENETTNKDLEQLRQFIQTVSRSANPLGKMLDYLQEDIDAMNQELKMWQAEHKQNILALRREENVTESILDPLGKQLEELDQAVVDEFDRISAVKASILHNDERIQRMLLRAQNV